MVDVGSEWRTFSNEKATSDPSRVGAAQVGQHNNQMKMIVGWFFDWEITFTLFVAGMLKTIFKFDWRKHSF